MMPRQPTLETTRRLLRPFRMADADAVQRLAGDRAVADTTLNIPHPYDDGLAKKWISNHCDWFDRGEQAVFVVTLKAVDTLIGCVGLRIHRQDQRAELGYWIGKPYWGQGYCTEAARAVLGFGFEQLALNRTCAHHFARNPPPAACLRSSAWPTKAACGSTSASGTPSRTWNFTASENGQGGSAFGAALDAAAKTKKRLEALTGLLSVVSVRLLQLKSAARTMPDRPAREVVPERWITMLQAARRNKKLVRAAPMTVGDFYRQLAMFGGFLGRKSDGEPGWITIWRGWQKLYLLVRGAELAQRIQ